jgi:putative transposase
MRKHPAHGIKLVDGQPTIVFDTLCLKRRHPILACQQFHGAFHEVARKATAWLMGRYVVMPDHIHFFAGYVGHEIVYESWVKYLKSQLTRHVKGILDADDRWLSDHWDCRIRNQDVYEEKWQYIRHNPVRGGLVVSADEWPYQGEVFELRWR